MIVNTESIVLKSFDYRETSRIATFFTKDHGKISGILKGIRKDPRKFGSSVDKFTINDMVYYRYSKSDLHLVSHCDLKQFFFPIRQDYKKNLAANYALELVDIIAPIEQKNRRIYQLLIEFLNSLEHSDDIDKLVHIYQIKILNFSGFRPHIDACVRCSKKIHGKARFSMKMGGLICSNCPTSETSFAVISQGTISSILHIEKQKFKDCLRLGFTKQVKKELKYILNNFLVYHLERKVKSAKYLHSA